MFYINTLTIAGSDCSGGAGIQADIKTMSALGCYAASVVTAVTAQNTTGVRKVMAVPADMVASQIDCVMTDISVRAVKIGMLTNEDCINAVYREMAPHTSIPIVTDPVMVSSHGQRLMEDDALHAFIDMIIPITFILTPNIPEAEVLAGMTINSNDDITEAARRILQMGCRRLLIKGGHITDPKTGGKTDRLFWLADDGTICNETFSSPAVTTRNSHGTGCTLSSAIAAFLARGLDEVEAVAKAKTFIYNALREGTDITAGKGRGPLNHFFNPQKMITQDR